MLLDITIGWSFFGYWDRLLFALRNYSDLINKNIFMLNLLGGQQTNWRPW